MQSADTATYTSACVFFPQYFSDSRFSTSRKAVSLREYITVIYNLYQLFDWYNVAEKCSHILRNTLLNVFPIIANLLRSHFIMSPVCKRDFRRDSRLKKTYRILEIKNYINIFPRDYLSVYKINYREHKQQKN